MFQTRATVQHLESMQWRIVVPVSSDVDRAVVSLIDDGLKGNDTVQIHFNYSYKLRIFFHIVRFAYHKMTDAKKLGASIKLREKEIDEGEWDLLQF